MFKWKLQQTPIAQNAIFLEDKNSQEGRPFKSRFLQAGLVKYDFGVCLLKKETIDKFINTFIGCPVIINHKDDISKDDIVGTIKNIWFSSEDGWFWCDGIIPDEKAIELIENGYNVSCQYRITQYSDNADNELHNGNPYDKEILNGVFEHLALVENPRYEDAFIAVNAYIQTDLSKFNKVFDYIKNYKGEPMDKETKGLFNSLLAALKARNEAEDEKEKDDKATNEDVDKRQGMEEVGRFLRDKGLSNEDIQFVLKTMFKDDYNKSSRGTADNTSDDDEDKKEDKQKASNEKVDKRERIRQIMALVGELGGSDEQVRTAGQWAEDISYNKSEAGTADNKAKNKCKNEDEKEEKQKAYEDLKEKVQEEAENKKAKNALDDAVNQLYNALTPKQEDLYVSSAKGLELGKQIYG